MWPIAFVGFVLALSYYKRRRSNIVDRRYIFSIIVYSGIGVKNLIKIGSYAMLALIVVILIIVIFRINILPSYLTARFSALENPFNFESGIGYHLSNSLLAIGNGGLFGRGLGNSIMKLGYLPEPHTDFILRLLVKSLVLWGFHRVRYDFLYRLSCFRIGFPYSVIFFTNWYVLVLRVILHYKLLSI